MAIDYSQGTYYGNAGIPMQGSNQGSNGIFGLSQNQLGGIAGGLGLLAPLAAGALSSGGSGSRKAASGISGALTGASTGATVGSVIPGVGTAIGAGVGALVGGLGGTLTPDQDPNKLAREQMAIQAAQIGNQNTQFSRTLAQRQLEDNKQFGLAGLSYLANQRQAAQQQARTGMFRSALVKAATGQAD